MTANGRRLDNTIARERAADDAHRSTIPAKVWSWLVESADRVWGDAHEASDALGVEYTAETARFASSESRTARGSAGLCHTTREHSEIDSDAERWLPFASSQGCAVNFVQRWLAPRVLAVCTARAGQQETFHRENQCH